MNSLLKDKFLKFVAQSSEDKLLLLKKAIFKSFSDCITQTVALININLHKSTIIFIAVKGTVKALGFGKTPEEAEKNSFNNFMEQLGHSTKVTEDDCVKIISLLDVLY